MPSRPARGLRGRGDVTSQTCAFLSVALAPIMFSLLFFVGWSVIMMEWIVGLLRRVWPPSSRVLSLPPCH